MTIHDVIGWPGTAALGFLGLVVVAYGVILGALLMALWTDE